MNQLKLMLVEDNETSSMLLRRMLEKYGYTVVAACQTGDEAIQQARQLNPDLILMDIQLPGGKDGIQTAEIIYAESAIPFIYITSSVDSKTIERAKISNPCGYIIKPYNINMIHAAIELAIHKHDSEKNLKALEERNRNILTAVPDVMFNLDIKGNFVDPLDAQSGSRVWNPDTRKAAVPVIEKVISAKETGIIEYRIDRNGTASDYEARIMDSAGERVLVIVRDVTARKRADAELVAYKENLENLIKERTRDISGVNRSLMTEIETRKATELNLRIFSGAIDQNPNVIIIINSGGQVQYVNSKYTAVSGYSPDDVIACNVNSPGNKIFPEPEMWNDIISQKEWKGEIYGLGAAGSIYYLNGYVSSLKNEQGQVSHYIISAEDITVVKHDRMEIERLSRILDDLKAETSAQDVDWQEWKEKMTTRSVMRADRSLFRNINDSFTQGAGFGTLTSMLELMSATAEKKGDRLIVDASIYGIIESNRMIAQDAFKTFTSIDWIISNEFNLEKVSMFDFFELIKGVVRKAENYTGLKKQRIIISDNNLQKMNISVNIQSDNFLKGLYEGLLNAMKFSKENSLIALIIHLNGRNLVLSILSEPESNDEGIAGIPHEYEKVVFEPFYRMTKFVYEQYNCLDFGLGLTLIDKIVNKHGGEAYIHNVYDRLDSGREGAPRVNLSMSIPYDES